MITANAGLLLALQHGAEESTGVGFGGPFTLNPGLIIWTWIVFIALFVALRRFAWPEILKATEEREKRIKQQLEEAERLNTEAKATLEENKKLLAGAHSESARLLNEAKSVAAKEREHLLAKTREEQEAVLDRTRKEIQAERDRAVADLRREAVELSIAVASKLVGQRLDSDADKKIVNDYLGSIGSGR